MTRSSRLNYLLFFILFLFTFIALIPYFASTSTGKQIILNQLNQRIPGTLAIDEMEFSWLGPQTFRGMKFRDNKELASFSVDTLAIDNTLFSLLLKKSPSLKGSGIDGTFIQDDGQAVRLSQVTVVLAEPYKDGLFVSTINGTTEVSNSTEGPGQFELSVYHKRANPLSFITHKKGLINLKLQQFPIGLLDVIVNLVDQSHLHPVPLRAWIGDRLNLNLIHTRQSDQEGFVMTGNSNIMTLNATGSIENGKLHVDPGAYLSTELSDDVVQRYFDHLIPKVQAELDQPLLARFELTTFDLPLAFFEEEADRININEMKIDAAFSLTASHLKHEEQSKRLDLNYINAHLFTESGLNNIHFDLNALAKQGGTGMKVRIDGMTLKPSHVRHLDETFKEETAVKIEVSGLPQLLQDEPNAPKEGLIANIELKKGHLSATTTLGQSLTNLFLPSEKGVSIESPVVVNLQMERWETRFPQRLTLSLVCGVTQIKIKGRFDLENGFALSDPITSQIKMTPGLFATLFPSIHPRLALAQPTLIHLLIDEPRGRINFKHLSRSYLSGQINIPEVSLMLQNQNEPITLRNILLPWKLNGTANTIKVGFISQIKSDDAALSGTIEGKFNIRDWIVDNRPLFSQARLEGDIDGLIHRLSFTDQEKNQHYVIPRLAIKVNTADFAKGVQFALQADEIIEGSNRGKLFLKGSFDTEFSFLPASIQVSGDLRHVPIAYVSSLVSQDRGIGKQVEALIGPTLNAKIDISVKEKNGPLFITATGQHGEVHLDGYVDNGILKLNKSLEAKVLVTKNFRRHILKKLSPNLNVIGASENKVLFRIDPKNFSFPVHPFSISKIQVGAGALHLGKLKVQNKGALASFLSLLNDKEGGDLPVWCTPCYFNVKNGILGISRVDLLIADRYQIALWGKLDLPGDKVNVTLGLTGLTIGKAFNVGGLKDHVMVTVPIKGSFEKIKIDKRKAMTKIASAAVKKDGDVKGILFGTVLDIATGNILDSSTPPPTTQPFPWDKRTN